MALLVSCWLPGALRSAQGLPNKLTDEEFWRLTTQLSEPEEAFPSDNLVSNEGFSPQMVMSIVARTKPGRVYLGVGPEQNFTYIALSQPAMAFIIDIRRGNFHLQLMYKALFELSADRAAFLSRLFTRERPKQLTSSSTVAVLMDAYSLAPRQTEAAFESNFGAIRDHLAKKRAPALSASDLEGVARVYRAFYWYGPAINFGATLDLKELSTPGLSYRDLMTSTSATGQGISYLTSEAAFGLVRDLQRRNLVVPVVGNFSGPKTVRAVGSYIRDHGGTVGFFYVSNVETYLIRNGTWQIFCASVRTLPLDEWSVFVRPSGPVGLPGGIGVVPIAPVVESCSAA